MKPRPLEIALHSLRVDRRALTGWSVAFVATLLMYLAFYPSIADSGEAYRKAVESFPEALKRLSGATGDLTSPAGYLQGQFFATFGFILLLVFAVARGARLIAGDERAGLLELILSTPTSRARLVVERGITLAVELAVLGAITFVVLLLLGPAFELDGIGTGKLAAACASASCGALVFGLVPFAAGGLSGEYGIAMGVGSAVAGVAFLYTTLSPLVLSLADHQAFSPCWQAFGYGPLLDGLGVAKLVVLLAEAAVLWGLAIWGFSRRDAG